MLRSFLFFAILFSTTAFSTPENTEEDYASPIKSHTTVSQKKFLKYYTVQERIGGGGESNVFKVTCKKTQQVFALTVQNQMESFKEPKRQKELITTLKTFQKKNPFQAKIYGYFWVENPNYPLNCLDGSYPKKGVLPFQNIRPGHILNDTYAEDLQATPYWHPVLLMELGLGDLESKEYMSLINEGGVLGKKVNRDDKVIRRWHMLHASQNCICTNDHKPRNFIYVPKKGLLFHGEPLDKYDYISWSLNGQALFLPLNEYIIKRVDFAGWTSARYDPYKELPSLKDLCEYFNGTEQEYRCFTVSPGPQARILEIEL